MAKKLPGTPIQSIPLKGQKPKPVKDWAPLVFNEANSTLTGFEVPKPVITQPNTITTTGVKAESYEQGMEHLYQFAARSYGSHYNYALLMREDDDSFTLYERLGQPCWGSLREYDVGTRPDDTRPGDLVTPDSQFPFTGKVEALSVVFGPSQLSMSTRDEFNRFTSEYAFNTIHSPWRSILKDIELVIKDDWFNGCVFKDCHIDPTVLAQFLRHCATRYSGIPKKWCNIMNSHADINGMVAHLKTINAYGYAGMSPRVVLERFFNANPFDLSNGGTLHDRESYNRPDRDYVFGGKGNTGVKVLDMSIEQLMVEFNSIMNKDEGDVNIISA